MINQKEIIAQAADSVKAFYYLTSYGEIRIGHFDVVEPYHVKRIYDILRDYQYTDNISLLYNNSQIEIFDCSYLYEVLEEFTTLVQSKKRNLSSVSYKEKFLYLIHPLSIHSLRLFMISPLNYLVTTLCISDFKKFMDLARIVTPYKSYMSLLLGKKTILETYTLVDFDRNIKLLPKVLQDLRYRINTKYFIDYWWRE